MKRALIVIVILAAVGFGVWRVIGTRNTDTRLRASGTVEANSAKVGSTIGGRVSAVHAREGQTVAAGAPLVSLETDLLDLSLREQQALISQREADLARALKGPRDEELARGKIEWAAAETDRKRLQALYDDGVIGRREYDAAQVREATSRESLRQLQNGSRREDVAVAKAALARERERLEYLLRQRREMEIVAPFAGTIEVLDLRPGDIVGAAQPVAEVLAAEDLWLRVYVPEPQLGRVVVGQQVSVSIDSHPERSFMGTVVEIRDRGEYTPRNIQTPETRVDQVFGVKVRLEPAPEIKAGMAATVRFEE